jgi:hypothetical protein
MTDAELAKAFKSLIEESTREDTICRDLGIPYFDTGVEYREKIALAAQMVR